MSAEKTAETQPPKHPYPYQVDGQPYASEQENVTGAYIKSQIPNFNPAYALWLEGQGKEKDRLITDSETVNLDPAHGGEKKFYTVPPATFGAK